MLKKKLISQVFFMTYRIGSSDSTPFIESSSASNLYVPAISGKENEALKRLFAQHTEPLPSLQINQQHIPKNIHEKLWEAAYGEAKKQGRFSKEEDFAINILENRSKYKPEMILAAAVRFLGNEHSKRLPNGDIVYHAPYKKGREDKIRIIRKESQLAKGGQNIIYLATGMAFVKRGGKVSYSGEKKRVVRETTTTLLTGVVGEANIETPRAIHLHAKEKLGKGMEGSKEGALGVERSS